MSLRFRDLNDSEYFDQLPKSTQEIVSELILEASENHHDACGRDVEQIECRSRSGFIPSSSNYGGMQINQFTDLAYFWGGGHSVSHKEANADIQRQIEQCFAYHSEHVFEKFETLLNAKKITKEQCNYHDLQDLAKTDGDLYEVAQYCENSEMDFLSGDDSSIMLQVRFLYHGRDEKGLFTASVSCAVNTEGPYHRSRISWAPGVFCEGSKEVEISWKNDRELKKTLKATLKTLTEQVF
jgi:hypothetical protein